MNTDRQSLCPGRNFAQKYLDDDFGFSVSFSSGDSQCCHMYAAVLTSSWYNQYILDGF